MRAPFGSENRLTTASGRTLEMTDDPDPWAQHHDRLLQSDESSIALSVAQPIDISVVSLATFFLIDVVKSQRGEVERVVQFVQNQSHL